MLTWPSVHFSCSDVSDSLWPSGLQHSRLLCPSPTPTACSNHIHQVGDAIQPFHPLSSPSPDCCLQSFRVFSSESVLCIRWPKYWNFSFSISPSNKYSGLISFRTDWFDLLAVQGILKASPTPQFKSISYSELSFLYSPTLTSIHNYWKNHSFD